MWISDQWPIVANNDASRGAYLFNVSVLELVEVETRTPLVTVNRTRLDRQATVRRRGWTVVQEHVSVAFERLQRLREPNGLCQRAGQLVGLALFGHRVQAIVSGELLAEYRWQTAGGRSVRRSPRSEVGTVMFISIQRLMML